MGCCCCCFSSTPESSRAVDEHVPLSYASPSSVLTTEVSISPPIPLAISPRNQPKAPITHSNSSQEGRGNTHTVPEKETWTGCDLKKKDREVIEECPICLEEYETENPRLLTKCGHDFHLACILEWMERSEACPVCDKDLVLTE